MDEIEEMFDVMNGASGRAGGVGEHADDERDREASVGVHL